ncbi:response regulator transcription factor [Luedemannella flava]|uniref:response regulator transcription factor n=1 Tax=Luedemannella flava TaxID=349316 RepID=UPI0031CDEB5C
MLRVLLCHKGTLFRCALATVLSQEDDIEIVGTVGPEDALATASRARPHVTLLDLSMAGPVAAEELCRALCDPPSGSAVLVLLDRQVDAAVGRSLARLSPQVGFLTTDVEPAELVTALRLVARGEPVLDTQLAVAALAAASSPLTERESEVLRLAVAGTPADEIAAALSLSPGTVRNYLSRAVAKTGGRTRIEAIRIARDAGWI